MKYLQYTFTLTPSSEVAADVLSALLAEIGFESFVHSRDLTMEKVIDPTNPEADTFAYTTDEDQYSAYVQKALFDEEAFKIVIQNFPLPDVQIDYECTEPEDKDWNVEWERNYFQPILVEAGGHSCSIASTFHKDVPEAEYAIRIDPRMSFGTGHHQTTSQMISRLLETDLMGKEVLDMGCGTSILAILARMRGAHHCWGIDIDEWCVENSRENIALNHLDGIDVTLGTAETLATMPQFDLIIANINRNILLQDMPAYVSVLRPGGQIFMSGFYTEDISILETRANELGLTLTDVRSRDNWACLAFQKS